MLRALVGDSARLGVGVNESWKEGREFGGEPSSYSVRYADPLCASVDIDGGKVSYGESADQQPTDDRR